MDYEGKERRRYIRLDSVFPVEFKLIEPPSSERSLRELSEWQQGFTRNVSKEGMCLTVNNLDPQFVEPIVNRKVQIALTIHIPLGREKVKALANIIWVKKQAETEENTYSIGLSYESIDSRQNRKILCFAYAKVLLPKVIGFIIAVLIALISLSIHFNYRLMQTSRELVEELVLTVQKSSIAKQQIKQIKREKAQLESKLALAEFRLKAATDKISRAKDREIDNLMDTIERLQKEKLALQQELIKLQDKENSITEELLMMTEKTVVLEKVNLERMYGWLQNRQNVHTGLIGRVEGDPRIKGWAFTYEQAIASIVYTYFGDYVRAEKILDFYANRAEKIHGGFLNTYYADNYEVAEYAVYTGPNIWIGIAAIHYANATQDMRYLKLAGDLADWIMTLQDESEDKGIRGGPEFRWHSTKHNLDAYAFLRMLYELTGNERYNKAAQLIFQWLVNHIDKPELSVKEDKGDITTTTNTYAWSIVAIGPERLFEAGMDADKILELVKAKCLATTSYRGSDGETITVSGFDFALSQRVGRSPVISAEWTAQMVISYRIMYKYYQQKADFEKAKYYDKLANDYLTEITKLIISASSPTGEGGGYLLYTTSESSDTGGWMTSRGNRGGSVAGIAYALFAFNGFNPLQLEE